MVAHIVAQGDLETILKANPALPPAYLNGEMEISIPGKKKQQETSNINCAKRRQRAII
jgi:excinuclease UvrABC ATPase subunit